MAAAAQWLLTQDDTARTVCPYAACSWHASCVCREQCNVSLILRGSRRTLLRWCYTHAADVPEPRTAAVVCECVGKPNHGPYTRHRQYRLQWRADARPDAGAGTLPDLARTVPYGEPQGSELRPPARRVSSDSLCSGPPCVVEYWTIHWHPSRRRTQPSFTAGLGAAAIYGCPPLEALRRPTPATTQPSS